ncbi:MAG: phosphate-starvation-inducible PsiE family protein [Acidilobus sp.]
MTETRGSGPKSGSIGRNIDLALLIVESLIALVIVIIIGMGVYASLVAAFTSLKSGGFSGIHNTMLALIDLVIIMLLAADLLRTIVITVREGRVPVQGIVEIAMIVVVREMVATSIEGVNVFEMGLLALALVAISGAYALIRKWSIS